MTLAQRMLAYDPNQVKPGWIAFFIVMGLLVATFLLWRNMNKQMTRIRVPHRAEFRDQTPRTAGSDPVPGPGTVPDAQPDDEARAGDGDPPATG